MKHLSRRDFIRALGFSSLAAAGMGRVSAQPIHEGSKVVDQITDSTRGSAAFLEDGKVIQPQREIPVFRDTDVLVVGGGTAGVAAALAARRAGVNVTAVSAGCGRPAWFSLCCARTRP